MTSPVTFLFGLFTSIVLIVILCLSDFVECNNLTESETDSQCFFECQSPDEYATRLTKMETMYEEYHKIKKVFEKYFGPTKIPLDLFQKLMVQLAEIGPEGVLQFVQTIKEGELGKPGETEKNKGKGQTGAESPKDPEPSGDPSITSCSVAMEKRKTSGQKKQIIYPYGNSTSVEVLCDFDVDGGGWTVIQKRSSGPRNEFDKDWDEYVKGFGSLDGNFWLGLENIYALTKNEDQELRIELEDFEGKKAYAKYSTFSISDASDFYRLKIGDYSGDAGDSLASPGLKKIMSDATANGMRFTTKDIDNDKLIITSCARVHGGGWWFNDCSQGNLNQRFRQQGEAFEPSFGFHWQTWTGNKKCLAKTEMKIRKKK